MDKKGNQKIKNKCLQAFVLFLKQILQNYPKLVLLWNWPRWHKTKSKFFLAWIPT